MMAHPKAPAMAPRTSPSLLAPLALLSLLAAGPSAAAWDWTQDEPNLVHGLRDVPAAGSTYLLVGVDLGQPPGPTVTGRQCWRVSGDLSLQEGAPGCWREESAEGFRVYQAKVVVAAVILGEHRCFAEVDGTQVNRPCCSRDEDDSLPPCEIRRSLLA